MGNNLSIRAKAALLFYRGLYATAAPLAFAAAPLMARFSRRVKDGINDYLGNVETPKTSRKPVLWVHGVSMGESMVALGFAKELRKKYPDSSLVFTTTHPDVIKDAKKKKIADVVAYFPLDNKRAMGKIFDRWKPDTVFVAETDFWPEFSHQCRMRGIPLMLINGRISSKIESFYTKAKGIAEIVFGAFSCFAVQSQSDADRLMNIGVSSDKIHVLGNMKADFTHTSQVDLATVREWINNRRAVVFGSLHPEEFELLKPLFKKLSEEKIAVIIAPRNITLAENWKKSLKKCGLKVCSKTAIEPSEIMLLDTIGELASVYKLSSCSFVGGSLDHNKTGGHNPLEVLQQKVPLLMGPYCRNFADIVEQLKTLGGISLFNDADDGFEKIIKIINDPILAEKMKESGERILTSNQGVLEKTIKLTEIYTKEPALIFTSEFLADLQNQARESARLRINYDLRNTKDDGSQRILNAMEKGTVVPVHSHPDTSETVVLLKGAIDWIFYDENGKETKRYRLNPKNGVYGLQVPAGQLHSIEVLESGSVIFEAKDGRYIPGK